jgi:hypothetical protein
MGSETKSKDSAIVATLSFQRFETITRDSIVSIGSIAKTEETKVEDEVDDHELKHILDIMSRRIWCQGIDRSDL